ncbi:hypothetical protein Tco_1568224 [Tanacetum coccineum]
MDNKRSLYQIGDGKFAKSNSNYTTRQVFVMGCSMTAMDYMETDAYMQKGVSTEDQISTVKPDEGTDKPKVSTDKPKVSTAKPKEVEVSIDKLDKGTAEPKDGTSDESTAPTTVFRDDENIAEFLVSMSQNKAKQKGVEIKDAEDSNRPRATSTRLVLTLKPLPKLILENKAKKVTEGRAESDAESEGVDEAERKFDQLAKDEEIARKARIEANRLLAARLQKEEREMFTVEERAKFLYDTITAQRRSDKNFIAIGFAENKRQIKEMNEESKDPKKKRLKKRVVNETPREEDTAKVLVEQEVTEQGKKKRKSGHVKMIARKRPRPQPDDEHRKCLRIVTFDSTIDSEIMETKSFVSKLHKQYSKITPKGIELILWGDLKIMMESSTEANNQGWDNYLHASWKEVPSHKELLQRMLDLGLKVQEESTATLHLLRFIKQQLNKE